MKMEAGGEAIEVITNAASCWDGISVFYDAG